MRGTKLVAWRMPQIARGEIVNPENSMTAHMQSKLFAAIDYALAAVAADVGQGILETIGLQCEWWTEDREKASVVVYLPAEINPKKAAVAIDLENLEAWLDEKQRLHIAISPFYSVKDIDQTILCTIKVLSRYTGLSGFELFAHSHH